MVLSNFSIFWLGVFIGANVGVLIMGLMRMAQTDDRQIDELLGGLND